MRPQSGLNPQAPPFIPLNKPLCQNYVVSHLPPPDCVYLYHPTVPPFLPSHKAEASYVSAQEANHRLYAETDHQKQQQQEEAVMVAHEINNIKADPKGVSKQRFSSVVIGGGRRRKRIEGHRGKGFRPPPWAHLPGFQGVAGGGHEGFCKDEKIHVANNCDGEFRAFVHRKRSHHPVVPVRSDGNDTTVMIRNIPNKYNRAMLVEFLDNHCLIENQKEKLRNIEQNKNSGEEQLVVSAYDLVYLPIDFKSRLNKGYAFVNFTNPKGAWKFHSATNDQKWDFFQSHKICDVAVARLQGKEKLQRHLESMSFPCEWEEVLPVCFSPPRDGTNKGVQRTLGKLVYLTVNN